MVFVGAEFQSRSKSVIETEKNRDGFHFRLESSSSMHYARIR